MATPVVGLGLKQAVTEILNTTINSPILRPLLQSALPFIVPEWQTWLQATRVELRAQTLKHMLEQQAKVEAVTGPLLLGFAAMAIKDFLGIDVSAGTIGLHGAHAGRQVLADTVGKQVLGAMFGAFTGPGGGSPAAGLANAERLLSACIETGLEGWLASNVTYGWLTEDLPNVGDLDDVISRQTGMQRAAARALRPLIDHTIYNPFDKWLNNHFRRSSLTEAQAARAVNRGHISVTEYFDLMAHKGWTSERAGILRLLNSETLSRSDIQRLLNAGVLTDSAATNHLTALGYTGPMAETVLWLLKNERLQGMNGALAQLARDMFRDREIGQDQFLLLLQQADYTPEERAQLLAIGQLERSRPRRLSASTMEEAFREDLVDTAALGVYFAQEGYSPADVQILVTLAVRAKLRAEARDEAAQLAKLPKLGLSHFLEFHRRGIIASQELVTALAGLKYTPAAIAPLLAQAEQRRAAYVAAEQRRLAPPRGITVTRAALEEGFIRGIVTAAQLQAAYTAAGFPAADVALLMALRTLEAQEAAAAADAPSLPEGAGATKPLAQV